jgi:hypothetical protein
MRRRPAVTAASILALVLTGAVVPLTGATTARAAERTATLVGSLQDELGCPGDWQPDCTATDLALEPGTTTYSAQFDVPAGSYELKVAINHTWDESYGQDGGSANLPLVLERPTPSASSPRTCRVPRPRPTPPSPATPCAPGRRASASTSSWPTGSPTATRPTTAVA